MVSINPTPLKKAPQIIKQNTGKRIINWEGQKGSVTYELLWNGGVEGNEAIYMLGKSKKTERVLVNLNMKKYYKFQVKVTNQCG